MVLLMEISGEWESLQRPSIVIRHWGEFHQYQSPYFALEFYGKVGTTVAIGGSPGVHDVLLSSPDMFLVG